MATGESRIPGIEEWADRLAVGALVVGGLLVSIRAPILRKRNETLRADLDGARLSLADVDDILDRAHAEGQGDEDQGAEPAQLPTELAEEFRRAHPGAAELNGRADLGA